MVSGPSRGRPAGNIPKGADEQSSRRTPGSLRPGRLLLAICAGPQTGVIRGGCLPCPNRAERRMTMRLRLVLAFSAGMVAFGQPAATQVTNDDAGGVPTLTKERVRAGSQTTSALNWLGLIGLIGLWGLPKGHEEDSYHPSDID